MTDHGELIQRVIPVPTVTTRRGSLTLPGGVPRAKSPATPAQMRPVSPNATPRAGPLLISRQGERGVFTESLDIPEEGVQKGPKLKNKRHDIQRQRPPSVHAFRPGGEKADGKRSSDGVFREKKPESPAPMPPAPRSTTKGGQYHPQVLNPKVMSSYERVPGQIPRPIAIERKKLLYAQQNIRELLEKSDVDPYLMDPDETVNRIPLECFDDTEWDSRTSEEWAALRIGPDGEDLDVPVLAMEGIDGRRWLDAHMLEYDTERHRIHVEFLDTKTGSDPIQRRMWLPRIYVMFRAEDPVIFCHRVVAAMKTRREAITVLKYMAAIQSTPLDGLSGPSSSVVADIMARVGHDMPSQDVHEMERDYRISMVHSLYSSVVRGGMKAFATGDWANALSFEETIHPAAAPAAPSSAVLVIPERSPYATIHKQYCFHTLHTAPEVLTALLKVRSECNKIAEMSLFGERMAKSYRLDEFEAIQISVFSQAISALKDSWIPATKNIIFNALRDVHKGWFNLQQNSREVYEISKLKRFMVLVRFMMEDALRNMTLSSLRFYVQMIAKAAAVDVHVVSSVCVEEKDREPKRTPLFGIELVLNDKKLSYSTPTSQFVSVASSLYKKAAESVTTVPELETIMMEHLFLGKEPRYLATVSLHEPEIAAAHTKIEEIVSSACEYLIEYLGMYDKYCDIFELDVQDYLQEYAQEEHTSEELVIEVERIQELIDDVEVGVPRTIGIGIFSVNCEGVRSEMLGKCINLRKGVLEITSRIARSRSEIILHSYGNVIKRLMERPKNIEEVADLKRYIQTFPQLLGEMQGKLREVTVYYTVLDDFRYNITPDDFSVKWVAHGGPSKIQRQVTETELLLKKDTEVFLKDMLKDQEALEDEIQDILNRVGSLSHYTDVAQLDAMEERVIELQENIERLDGRVKLVNSREVLFGRHRTQYGHFYKIAKDFDPYYHLWTVVANWTRWKKSWIEDPFVSLNPSEIEENVTTANRAIVKCMRAFRDTPALHEIATTTKNELVDFSPHVKLILALRSPGMRDRHWENLSKELKQDLHPDENLTLAKMLEQHLDDHIELFQKISEVASKEFAIESALDKMLVEWEDIIFTLIPYRETGTCIMKGADEIQALLDDHIVKTQSMAFSVYRKPFEERIEEWEKQLSLTAEILDEWLMAQRQWLYLEPIFSSEDILMQMPAEAKRFAAMERLWKQVIEDAEHVPHVMKLCSSDKLLLNFRECNRLLDQVQRGLSAYLESKRSVFPRFYFLSDDEMLEILSQARDPRAVQPHLRKCFENIARLEFQQDLEITAMISSESEVIPFAHGFLPQGNVENWLLDVEDAMRVSVRQQLEMALEDYGSGKRTDWVQKWPGQIVLVGSLINFTLQTIQAINDGTLEELHQKLSDQLADLTELVQGRLTPLAVLTLSALIVNEVHSRDTITNLIEQGVTKPSDFEWLCQLRYAWEDGNCRVEQLSASFMYGYEYLGNTTRLVITPLTDRCYMTLTSALQLQLGGAPQGPAGTGKTETTKDLAKAMGKQAIVFNCSDGLDYLAMGKFFKGLASSGAWACFDEFNRIDIEVLSVIAQQILTIQKAIQGHLQRFQFEGDEISLDPTCAVFITMNPGYAGRTELPDNLKALFRPMAMMIPDYALIAEIMLYSFGFKVAKSLANKMVATFRLSSEQLSSQDHYDFGMRAVKAVISAAGNLKQADPFANEELLLLRALRDVNVPKFLAADLPLFHGIISDLFPGLGNTKPPESPLIPSIEAAARALGLQPVPSVVKKCVQLWDTIQVRHGLMLVGPTGGGKTSCYKILAKALTSLSETNDAYHPAKYHVLNPKSIEMGQLYGEFDMTTHEWTEGVFATMVRRGARDTSPTLQWLVLDGPVDALWIENMNTVLDDNKKLCLSNGEIIPLTPVMTMMFEVEDLAVASPATVSRCGMVYMEPEDVGIQARVTSWLDALPDPLQPLHKSLSDLFDQFLEPCLEHVRKHCKEWVGTSNGSLTHSLCRLMMTLLTPLIVSVEAEEVVPDASGEIITQDNEAHVDVDAAELVLPSLFIFAMTWSVGATTDTTGRASFDGFMWDLIMKNGLGEKGPPNSGCLYDYCVKEDGEWVGWMDTIGPFEVDLSGDFSQVIVPTIDSVRFTHILDLLLVAGHHVLAVGPGPKSVTIMEKLLRGMPERIQPLPITFSARTSVNQTQDILDSQFDKRRKDIYGPPVGKRFIIFVDDLNMPQKEQFGAQPPIEILRQWFDHKGWYDRKTLRFKEIVDVNYVAAMGPPGGGRHRITNRLVRHFNMISSVELGDTSLKHIFTTILGAFLDGLADPVSALCTPAVNASVEVYQTIRNELLPTPSKSHYTFNMRDLAGVFRGVLSSDKSRINTPVDLVRLWCHETMRVFRDRLINEDDREWFDDLLKKMISKHLDTTWETTTNEIDQLMFGDWIIPNSAMKSYALISSPQKTVDVLSEYLDDYNSINQPMQLVLFKDCIDHIARVSRIIRQPRGNALLLGVGGSGKRSIARLASFMAEYRCFEIEVRRDYTSNEWHEDIKKVLTIAGMDNKQITFLFSDTQIMSESFVEDLNNLLNAGDVPNMWGPDELETIYQAMTPIVMAAGVPVNKNTLFKQFLQRVQSNLHICLCMSPIGADFRNRLRQFPSLISCTTLDWFDRWPEQALSSVAASQLISWVNAEFGESGIPADIKNVIKMCVNLHRSVEEAAADVLQSSGNAVHVTPTSYLELIGTIQRLYSEKNTATGQLLDRLHRGLNQLQMTAAEVAKMQDELQGMQPVLQKYTEENEEMMARISVDKLKADETRQMVATEEAGAEKKADETKAIAEDAKRDLDKALPALEDAVRSLKTLNKADIYEVRAMLHPPTGVKLVLSAVCIMKGVKPRKIDSSKPGEKIDDYWENGRQMLGEGKFLESLYVYDRDNIPDSIIRSISPYIEMKEFQPDEVAKVSKACTSLCLWVRAMERYYWVNKAVQPKRERLREAQNALDATLRVLNDAKWRLREVEANIQELVVQYDDSVAKKEELATKVDEVETKLHRAQKLMAHLGGENERWQKQTGELVQSTSNMVGDVLISAGTIAYLGPFQTAYRKRLIKEWYDHLSDLGINYTGDVTLTSFAGDPVRIRQYIIDGLPRDELSIENSVIIEKARRWPLMIDPQRQANQWTRVREKDQGLDVLRPTDKDFIRKLENAIQFGKPVLLENVEDELDTILEPILQRQTFRQGGQVVIKLGDSVIPCHSDFRLYITSRLPSPQYKPEDATMVTLLHFATTQDGLEDQLLSLIVAKERPDLEELKNQLVLQNARMQKELRDMEDRILIMLGTVEGSILENEDVVNTLAEVKRASSEIQEKLAETEQTQKEIDITRQGYRPVARRAATLFFCIADMANVDPMYQYSLSWFVNLFSMVIENSAPSSQLEERLTTLNEEFMLALYKNVCRSLFERHKLLFSFLLCIRVMQGDGLIDPTEWRFLLTGTATGLVASESVSANQKELKPDWLPEKSWNEIIALSSLKAFSGLMKNVGTEDGFRTVYDSHSPDTEPLPPAWQDKLSRFQRMMILRCLRPDRIIPAIQTFVTQEIGQVFIEPPTFDLMSSYTDSSSVIPLIFVLSPGADPTVDLTKFAEEMRFGKKLYTVSLGQGQGPRAESMIQEGVERGWWVCLSNCHLAPSWMPRLESIVEGFTPASVHRDFRLWLTSMPSKAFPSSVLQNAVKMTNEPPKGLRANLLRSYHALDDAFLQTATNKPEQWQRLLYGLSFFHANILERRKFGPLGWSVSYEFTQGDWDISMRQIRMYIDTYPNEIPFKMLSFLIGHINYGGRVTDDWDRRTLMSILKMFFGDHILNKHSFSPSGVYISLPVTGVAAYQSSIRALPMNDSPEIFGLHDNADITAAQNEAESIFRALLFEHEGGSTTGARSDKVLLHLAADILARLPESLDYELAVERYPVKYEESMNTVLLQEIILFNRLLATIRETLIDLQRAINGLVVMSDALEKMAHTLYNSQVPELWSDAAYPSLKPLGAWVLDLLDRLNSIQQWIDGGIPKVFWISGFFFPQAFFTGTLQNYARKHQVSIDKVSFDFEIVGYDDEALAVPDEGCYVRGLYLEGAKWDHDKHLLAESDDKELHTHFPIVWFKPTTDRQSPDSGVYLCPLYKTLTRAGTLSTTGHSTNYVTTIEIPTSVDQDHWIRRGVALICALNF